MILVAVMALSLTAYAEEKAKVTIWITFTEEQEAYINKAAADFNASQDKAVVEVLTQPYSGFTDSVYSAVNEGIGPDIIFNYASEAAKYDSSKLTDLSQYIYDDEIGIEGFDTALIEGVMNGEVKAFANGLIPYLPAYTTGPILYYNKTLYEELGLEVPTTWEEMEANCAVIKEKKDIPGMGFDGLTDFVQMLIMESPNSGYIDVANKVVLFDTEEVRERIAWAADMVKKGYFSINPADGKYFSPDFSSKTVAAFMGSCAAYPYLKPDGFEFAMAPIPAQTWYPSWNRGPVVFYYGDDARAEGAYEFVKYFISPEVNAGWLEAANALAPYSWTKETDSYKAYIANTENMGVQALMAVNANLHIAGSLPAVTGAAAIRDYVRAALEKAASGDMTVDEAWTECVTLSNAALQGK
jgi:ABC-type glycerol-3-phosphate transport system substrate-binding protein